MSSSDILPPLVLTLSSGSESRRDDSSMASVIPVLQSVLSLGSELIASSSGSVTGLKADMLLNPLVPGSGKSAGACMGVSSDPVCMPER